MLNHQKPQPSYLKIGLILIGMVSLGLMAFKLSHSAHLGSEPIIKVNDNQSLESLTQDREALTNLKADLMNGAALIDVRTPAEFTDGHARAAINLPLDQIQDGQMPQFAKNHKIYLYCRSGNRSAYAKRLLEQQGFTNVIDAGGLDNLNNFGLELVR